LESRPIPKYAPPSAGEAFGARLARLRKAAGFTQVQLAQELRVPRRRIAYYEAESNHPPAILLRDLARALNTPVEELLGSQEPKRKTRPGSLSPELERRLKQIERLSPKSKRQLLSIIDAFIAAEQNRQGPSS